jgi:hypothetical protein
VYSDCLLHELQSASLPEDLITITHTFQPWLLSSVPPSDTLGGFPPCFQVWRLLMPLLHSRPFQRLFPNARPFWVSCSTLFLVQYFLMKFPSHRATLARLVILLPAMTNSMHVPQFPCVRFSG